ncbi:efflux pump antibiotic resistance protein [Apiospora sp. TS-2023a]
MEKLATILIALDVSSFGTGNPMTKIKFNNMADAGFSRQGKACQIFSLHVIHPTTFCLPSADAVVIGSRGLIFTVVSISGPLLGGIFTSNVVEWLFYASWALGTTVEPASVLPTAWIWLS